MSPRSLVLILVLAACPSRPAHAQIVDPRFPIPDGPVNAMVRSGSTLYLGGQFNFLGYDSGPGVFSTTTGRAVGSPKIFGRVTAVVSDGEGGWFVGGPFTQVGGHARPGLAHIRADLSVSPWNPNAGGGFTTSRTVNCFALSGSTLYLGGSFLDIGGTSRAYLAAVDATTGALLPWNTTCLGNVNAIAIDGGSVIAGGEFLGIGGFSRTRLARIDGTTGAVASWNPGADGVVRALQLDGSTVYVGGDFVTCGSATRRGVAAVDVASGIATAWAPPINVGTVHSLGLNAGSVYLGGNFQLGGPTLGMAALDAVTAAPTGFSVAGSMVVRSMQFGSGVVYVTGNFTRIGNRERWSVGAIDLATSQATAFESQVSGGEAGPLVLGAAGLFMGGSFTRSGWVRHNLAALDLDSGPPTAWDPNLYPMTGGPVYAMAQDGSRLLIGGSFDNVGQQYRSRLAAVDVATGLTTAWDPNVDGTVRALEIDGSTLYLGGSFAHVTGTPRSNLASIDLGSGLLTAWDPEAAGVVRAIATGPTDVYLGGDFTFLDGVGRNFLGSFDRATGDLTAWAPNPNQYVYDIEVGPAAVYVGGYFATIQGQSRVHLAAFDVTTGSLLPGFVPSLINESGHVSAIKQDGNSLYIAGSFRTVANFRYHLAALDAASGSVLPWELDVAGSTVLSFVARDHSLYLGGSYTMIDSQSRPYFTATQRYPLPLSAEPAVRAASSLDCRPNPANRVSRVAFALPSAGHVDLACYDLLGRRVITVARGECGAGPHERRLDVSGLKPGVYLLRLRAAGVDDTRRIVVSH